MTETKRVDDLILPTEAQRLWRLCFGKTYSRTAYNPTAYNPTASRRAWKMHRLRMRRQARAT